MTDQNGNTRHKILLVEDDTFLREIYAHVFRKQGHTIEEAGDGEAGLNKAEADQFDLILLDILLPKKNGIEVLRELRTSDSKAYRTPILLLTNLGQESIIREAFLIGADGYLLKADLLPREVLQKVEAFMAGKLTKDDFLHSQSMD